MSRLLSSPRACQRNSPPKSVTMFSLPISHRFRKSNVFCTRLSGLSRYLKSLSKNSGFQGAGGFGGVPGGAGGWGSGGTTTVQPLGGGTYWSGSPNRKSRSSGPSSITRTLAGGTNVRGVGAIAGSTSDARSGLPAGATETTLGLIPRAGTATGVLGRGAPGGPTVSCASAVLVTRTRLTVMVSSCCFIASPSCASKIADTV